MKGSTFLAMLEHHSSPLPSIYSLRLELALEESPPLHNGVLPRHGTEALRGMRPRLLSLHDPSSSSLLSKSLAQGITGDRLTRLELADTSFSLCDYLPLLHSAAETLYSLNLYGVEVELESEQVGHWVGGVPALTSLREVGLRAPSRGSIPHPRNLVIQLLSAATGLRKFNLSGEASEDTEEPILRACGRHIRVLSDNHTSNEWDLTVCGQPLSAIIPELEDLHILRIGPAQLSALHRLPSSLRILYVIEMHPEEASRLAAVLKDPRLAPKLEQLAIFEWQGSRASPLFSDLIDVCRSRGIHCAARICWMSLDHTGEDADDIAEQRLKEM